MMARKISRDQPLWIRSGGKRYRWNSLFARKALAKKKAKSLRKRGVNAVLYYARGYWHVYTRR